MNTSYVHGTPEQRGEAANVTAAIADQMGRHHVRVTVSNPPGADFWEIGYVWQRPGAGFYGKEYTVTLARGDTFEQALDKARRKIKPAP